MMGTPGGVPTRGANLCTEIHLARQFKPRVAISMLPKKEGQDSDNVHLGAGKQWTANSRFDLAIDVSLSNISQAGSGSGNFEVMELPYNSTSSKDMEGSHTFYPFFIG